MRLHTGQARWANSLLACHEAIYVQSPGSAELDGNQKTSFEEASLGSLRDLDAVKSDVNHSSRLLWLLCGLLVNEPPTNLCTLLPASLLSPKVICRTAVSQCLLPCVFFKRFPCNFLALEGSRSLNYVDTESLLKVSFSNLISFGVLLVCAWRLELGHSDTDCPSDKKIDVLRADDRKQKGPKLNGSRVASRSNPIIAEKVHQSRSGDAA